MARARGIQQQMYPGMFRGTDVVERYRAAQQVKDHSLMTSRKIGLFLPSPLCHAPIP